MNVWGYHLFPISFPLNSNLQAVPNVFQVRKERLLDSEVLRQFQNNSSQMAALDFIVSTTSDVFIPTFDGDMAKIVEGHRRYELALNSCEINFIGNICTDNCLIQPWLTIFLERKAVISWL
jgi:hypothetical protein